MKLALRSPVVEDTMLARGWGNANVGDHGMLNGGHQPMLIRQIERDIELT